MALTMAAWMMAPQVIQAKEGVILLHGLSRTDRSMKAMATALESAGFVVLNVDYPSRSASVQELAEDVIPAAVTNETMKAVETLHFVTHSLGGILVRHYLKNHTIERLGRVVMLGPPNQGSEIVDKLGDLALFSSINGPSGQQLGTDKDAIPRQLGPVDFDLGIIAGDRSINLINSLTMIDGPDDGKVSVENTKVEGMKAHRVLHVTHPMMMRNKRVIRETIHFLRNGEFTPHKK